MIDRKIIRRNRLLKSQKLDLSKFPERPISKPSDIVFREFERAIDEEIGKKSLVWQRTFRLGTVIQNERPILGALLQIGSMCFAANQASR